MRHQFPDGTLHEFPDGTPNDTVARAIKTWMARAQPEPVPTPALMQTPPQPAGVELGFDPAAGPTSADVFPVPGPREHIEPPPLLPVPDYETESAQFKAQALRNITENVNAPELEVEGPLAMDPVGQTLEAVLGAGSDAINPLMGLLRMAPMLAGEDPTTQAEMARAQLASAGKAFGVPAAIQAYIAREAASAAREADPDFVSPMERAAQAQVGWAEDIARGATTQEGSAPIQEQFMSGDVGGAILKAVEETGPTMALMGPAAGVGIATSGAGLPAIVPILASAGIQRTLESVTESEDVRKSAEEMGLSKEEVDQAAHDALVQNMGLMGTDIMQWAIGFLPVFRALPKPVRERVEDIPFMKLSGNVLKTLGIGTIEGGEEAVQAQITKVALGQEASLDPRDWGPDDWEAFTLGGLMGLVGGSAQVAIGAQDEKQRKKQLDLLKRGAVSEELTPEERQFARDRLKEMGEEVPGEPTQEVKRAAPTQEQIDYVEGRTDEAPTVEPEPEVPPGTILDEPEQWVSAPGGIPERGQEIFDQLVGKRGTIVAPTSEEAAGGNYAIEYEDGSRKTADRSYNWYLVPAEAPQATGRAQEATEPQEVPEPAAVPETQPEAQEAPLGAPVEQPAVEQAPLEPEEGATAERDWQGKPMQGVLYKTKAGNWRVRATRDGREATYAFNSKWNVIEPPLGRGQEEAA